MTYLPLYAFDGEHKYRAVNTGFVTPTPRVTVDYANHLYVPAGALSTFAHRGRISAGPQQVFSARPSYAKPNIQHRQSNFQYLGSAVRGPSSNIGGIRRPGAIAARRIAKTQVHARPAAVATATRTGRPLSIQKRAAPDVRFRPRAVGIRQPRSFEQYMPPVIRMQPTPVSAASQL